MVLARRGIRRPPAAPSPDIIENDMEAHALLGLINAEFQTDPSSTACFDARIVERVRLCVAKRRASHGGL